MDKLKFQKIFFFHVFLKVLQVQIHKSLDFAIWSKTMNLNFRTNMSRQKVQTQIRLLLEEQSDQGLHCLPLHLRILSLSEFLDMLNELCGRAIYICRGQVAFVFKLPVGQVEFSGLFLTLKTGKHI